MIVTLFLAFFGRLSPGRLHARTHKKECRLAHTKKNVDFKSCNIVLWWNKIGQPNSGNRICLRFPQWQSDQSFCITWPGTLCALYFIIKIRASQWREGLVTCPIKMARKTFRHIRWLEADMQSRNDSRSPGKMTKRRAHLAQRPILKMQTYHGANCQFRELKTMSKDPCRYLRTRSLEKNSSWKK